MDRGNRKMSGIEVATLREVAENMKNGTYDFTDHGKCVQCGACCSDFLPITDGEISAIKKYVKYNNIKEQRHMAVLAQPMFDMTCPFLNTDKPKEKCMIYPVRPVVCKKFICCPENRTEMSEKYSWKCKLVSMRNTFFG